MSVKKTTTSLSPGQEKQVIYQLYEKHVDTVIALQKLPNKFKYLRRNCPHLTIPCLHLVL